MKQISVPRLLLAGALFIAAGGLAVSIGRAFSPPHLTIQNPASGMVVHDPFVAVTGRAPAARAIFINGIAVPLRSHDGTFEEIVPLSPGVNLLRIGARRHLSGMTLVERRVLYEPPAPVDNSVLPGSREKA